MRISSLAAEAEQQVTGSETSIRKGEAGVIDHFEIKVVHFDSCLRFYEAALKPLGIELKWADDSAAGFGRPGEPNVRFLIEQADVSAVCHIAFSAPDEQAVGEFFSESIAAGGKGNGEPGPREHYAPNYYAAFVLDPDGNNVEAVLYL